MKNNLQLMLIGCFVFICAWNPAFSLDREDLYKKENVISGKKMHDVCKRPGKGNVIIVGKVVLTTDENLDFLAKTRDVCEENLKNASVFTMPYQNDQFYADGECFFLEYDIDNDTDCVEFRQNAVYYFFADKKTELYLPLGFKIKIPEKAEYVYIGTLNYKITGDNFSIASVIAVDEYDDALASLKKETENNNVELVRVPIMSLNDGNN